MENYDTTLDDLYTKLTTRKFSYDPRSDPLYTAYADRYTQNGRMAMRDSMGQAAALTGGYGSSYSAAVGQQEYDRYMTALTDAMPQLYDRAWQRYTDEGDALTDAYRLSAEREATAYSRERDAIADQRYQDSLLTAQENTQYQRMQDSYSALVKLISTAGYQPTDGELAAAGLTRAQAEALRNQYLRENGLLPSQQKTVVVMKKGAEEDKEESSPAPTAAKTGTGATTGRTTWTRMTK